MKSYDTCDTTQITDENAIISSPSYPNSQLNLNCAKTISTNGVQKILNVYTVAMDLHITFANQE